MKAAQTLTLLLAALLVHGLGIAGEKPCADVPFVAVDARQATRVDELEGQVVVRAPSTLPAPSGNAPNGAPPLLPPGELAAFSQHCLTLYTSAGQHPATVRTAADGSFRFANPGPGDAILVASWQGKPLAARVRISTPPGRPERGVLLELPLGSGPAEVAAIGNLALRHELLEMLKVDQQARNQIIAKGKGWTDIAPKLRKRLTDTDARTARHLQDIVTRDGWPGWDLVGLDGGEAAMTMLMHVPASMQQEMLPRVEAAYRAHTVRGQGYAMLVDHVLISQGKPQRYGSVAASVRSDGQVRFFPIEDPAHVDERRAQVGLMPLARYRDMLRRLYFPTAPAPQSSSR